MDSNNALFSQISDKNTFSMSQLGVYHLLYLCISRAVQLLHPENLLGALHYPVFM